MKKLICFFTIFVFWGITDSMAQGLHFGVKAGVLGNKANISGMRDQFKEESLTGISSRAYVAISNRISWYRFGLFSAVCRAWNQTDKYL